MLKEKRTVKTVRFPAEMVPAKAVEKTAETVARHYRHLGVNEVTRLRANNDSLVLYIYGRIRR